MHNTYMPSVLIELGFLTNNSEGPFLNSKQGQSKMAQAIKNAILDYKQEIDQNVGESFYQVPKEATESVVEIYEGVDFKVQIAASSRRVETKPYNFNGLSPVSRLDAGTIYKYYFGKTNDYQKALELQSRAKDLGYSSAFVVAFKNDTIIPLETVLKSDSN
jgi:N-acetylmuramoyl-L-alanine amidase